MLLETYPYYIDARSRGLVEKCLYLLATQEKPPHTSTARCIDKIEKETTKTSIAPGNALVLVRWCSQLLQATSTSESLWKAGGQQLLRGLVQSLNTLLGSEAKRSTKINAIRSARRGLRTLFKSPHGITIFDQTVTLLTSKGPTSATRNAIGLGLVAGVASRLEICSGVLEARKKDFLEFYAREILGSRAAVPSYQQSGMKDFFATCVTLEDLNTAVVPALEKALLRAPEVVLGGIVSSMATALPESIDLAAPVAHHLLKPLLSNAKSTNAAVRTGLLQTFDALSTRFHDGAMVEQILEEILQPLSTGKLGSADQRLLYVSMLSSLPCTQAVSDRLAPALLALISKETNENTAVAEIGLVITCAQSVMSQGGVLLKDIHSAFAKGTADKKPIIRRAWLLGLASLLWKSDSTLDSSMDSIEGLVQSCAVCMISVFDEAYQNPSATLQQGLIGPALAVTAANLARNKAATILDRNPDLKRVDIRSKALATEPRLSFMLSPKVYSKLAQQGDWTWFVRALFSAFVASDFTVQQHDTAQAWAQAVLYATCAHDVPHPTQQEAAGLLLEMYQSAPDRTSDLVIEGLWQWCQDSEQDNKESAALLSKSDRGGLIKAVRCLAPELLDDEVKLPQAEADRQQQVLVQLLVLCQPSLLPSASWIQLCLRCGVDPGELVRQRGLDCWSSIVKVSTHSQWSRLAAIQDAAYTATAEMAFVGDDSTISMIVSHILEDLDPAQLDPIGDLEATIYRAPEGVPVVDVLTQKAAVTTLSKNSKEYDTLKWEQELRSQLAQKKGQTKKLTSEEQAKVSAQLSKEAKIRHDVGQVDHRLRRGIGIIQSLVSGPPLASDSWFGPVSHALFEIIQAGADRLLGDLVAKTYLKCAARTSNRLGAMRAMVGVAVLRTSQVSGLSEEFLVEPLASMVTRVLYRIRFLGEQMPFDSLTLSYILPLLLTVLEKGGAGDADAETADEQVLLAIEIISLHSDVFADSSLPREIVSRTLIEAMSRYVQHFREIKDCFSDFCRTIAPNTTQVELNTIIHGVIRPDPSVRGVVLAAISAELSLDNDDCIAEIWLARHDDLAEHRQLADEIWEENELQVQPDSVSSLYTFLESDDAQLRRATARSIAALGTLFPSTLASILARLKLTYRESVKSSTAELDRYGMPIKRDQTDRWHARDGISLALKEVAPKLQPQQHSEMLSFLIENGPFADINETVRTGMIAAGDALADSVESGDAVALLELCETTLQQTSSSAVQDLINEAVVIVYGALARHLEPGDARIAKVVDRLLDTLNTPSENVQFAVANCLSLLMRNVQDGAVQYLSRMVQQALNGAKYAERRGAAYGVAGIIKGRGLSLLKEARVLSALQGATGNKKVPTQRQGAFLVLELLSLLMGQIFEPYTIRIVPQLLVGFGDTSADVREACLDASKMCFKSLSPYGVQQVLPILLEGLDDQQWRSKKGACDSLGAMAYLDPQQLAANLPKIIPPLTEVLNDSHKEVRAAANRSLQQFGDVITNPEVKSQVSILLKALSDPTKYTDDALDALIKVNFVHYLDAPSLALIVRILERGLGDRSSTKRKASQIIGSLAHLTEKKDLIVHLPILVAGLRGAVVDPVPATRATASKALGSTVEKLGEDALPDLIPNLMQTLRSDTGAGDRLGSAQALSEVLAGLGTTRLEQTLPTILQNVTSSKAAVREGFMSLFIYLPACFGNGFANYLARVIPPILSGLADDVESIRETALRAGRLLVKNFAARSVDLLLPELERGLADDSHRIRLSSVELVGDLLFNLTGISGKAEGDEIEDNANEAGQSLLEVLGEEKRNKILSSLYICRNDTSGLVRTAAVNIWKALVSTPRTLRELIPTLTRLLIRRLASNNMEQKVIAGNALGELIRKAGDGVLSTLLPTLEAGLTSSTDVDAKQGICIALRELITSATPESLEQHETTLISVVRTALVDPDEEVRDAAAEAFDSLQKLIGKRAVDHVLPHLLSLLRSEDDAPNALAALLTLLTEASRANMILPNLLPTLLKSPISSFNARAIASLAEVAGGTMTRRLPNILNALMDNVVQCKDEELKQELEDAFDTVLLSVDEFDGLNAMMSVMLGFMKNDDHRKRATAAYHFSRFFQKSELDISRYHPDLIRILLHSFEDGDMDVVKAAWTALSALTQRLRKEEMEGLVISTRQALNHVGGAGQDLPGFTLPKGINAILPIFLQGLMNGSAEQRTQAAFAISDIVDRTNPDGLKPFVTQITGPLIRVVSERSTDLKAAILLTLTNLLEKIPTALKPFLPQLQRTFAKSLADPSSEVLRTRAAKALGLLIPMTPRIDPLIAELVTGSRTTDSGVRNAMLKALYEVVSKAGSNMSETSRNAIVGLIDQHQTPDQEDGTIVTYARLLGALIKVLSPDTALSLIKYVSLLSNMPLANADSKQKPSPYISDIASFCLGPKRLVARIPRVTILISCKAYCGHDSPRHS